MSTTDAHPDDGASSEERPPAPADPAPPDDGTSRPPRRLLRTAARLTLVVVALGLSAVVLGAAFDELEPARILEALGSLADAEVLALFSMWVLWIACQGLQTAALVEALPVRRGVLAFLGPTAVASVIPGPSDLPVRYRMFTSWGYSPLAAGVAISAGGIFSIGIKLVLPLVAAIGLLAFGVPLEGTLRTLVTIALAVGAGLVLVALVLGSERRTGAAGRLLDPIWGATAKLLRRDDPDQLADRLVATRSRALGILRGRWPMATWGTLLAAVTNFSLLVMALRFVGIPAEQLGWPQMFVVFALVQGLTVVPLTAGNAGVSEVAYIALLTAAAGQGFVNEVAAGVILYRLLTWVVIIPVGLGALTVWQLGNRRAPSGD